jgi:chaperonin GroEL
MPHKQVLFRSAAQEKILRGATHLADAVRVTMGPRWKSVLIERKWGVPVPHSSGIRPASAQAHSVEPEKACRSVSS